MSNFQYKHGNHVVIWTTYGKVTLTYVNPEKRKAEDPFAALYEEERKWDDNYNGNYFEATLHDEKGQIIAVAEDVTPNHAAAKAILEHLRHSVYQEIESIL
jgi:hypothetical protein